MPRIAGVDLPRDKRVEIGLIYIYGSGCSTSNEILDVIEVDPDVRVRDPSETAVSELRQFIDGNYQVEGDLRRTVRQYIQRLQEIGCCRGIRHRKGLPVRGQRTKTNARAWKGPRKMVAGRHRARANK